MNVRPSILCPVDYSDASAAALRHAAAIAEHFVTRLIVLTVESPLLAAAQDFGTGTEWTRKTSERELARFVTRVFGARAASCALCEYEVAIGKPALEILRVARERSCELIVMSSHGLTGPRKWLLGSTAERVLRETTVPVLVTPAAGPGAVAVEDAAGLIGRIVVPVDLSEGSRHQLRVASGLAEALSLPLVLVHVIEPAPPPVGLDLAGAEAERRADAEHAVADLAAELPPACRYEALVIAGHPAEAIAAVVAAQRAGLVVIGLHGGPLLGPRMGSVTYRTLCLSPALVLALPPQFPPRPARRATSIGADTPARGDDEHGLALRAGSHSSPAW